LPAATAAWILLQDKFLVMVPAEIKTRSADRAEVDIMADPKDGDRLLPQNLFETGLKRGPI